MIQVLARVGSFKKFLAAVTLVLSLATLASAAEFSADMVTKGGGQEMTGKVFVKGQKIRQEFGGSGADAMISIVRMDRKVTWVLMPQEKTYMEMPMKESPEDPALIEKADPAKVKRLGKETVNGFVCEKIQVTEKDAVFTQWLSMELGWPIKGEGASPEGSTSFEYKNIRKGGVSDILFDVPAGYRKMAVPGM